MNRELNNDEIDYLLLHLSHQAPNIKILFNQHVIYTNHSTCNDTKKIIFTCSSYPVNTVHLEPIDQLPVLFPVSNDLTRWYTLTNNGTLIFHHDILKSAFYILSGWDEAHSTDADEHGRFPHTSSLLYQLDWLGKPLVNYYFEIILNGIKEYLVFHKTHLDERKPFNPFACFISHDVDRIWYHHPREAYWRFKQLLGIDVCLIPRKKMFNECLNDLKYFWRYKSKDPWWTMDYLVKTSRANGMKNTFYLLDQSQDKQGSRYAFSNPHIQKWSKNLTSPLAEVDIHAPYATIDKPVSLKETIDHFKAAFGRHPIGVRHHFLRFRYPDTYLLHESLGLKYDASFGFAGKSGFRNGYCLPFMPYDHKANKIINLWVIPLNAMEVTFLNYEKSGWKYFSDSINTMVDETMKFGGVFSLLWHNCRFDEKSFPGITDFYSKTIKSIHQKGAKGILGSEIASHMDSLTSGF